MALNGSPESILTLGDIAFSETEWFNRAIWTERHSWGKM